MLGRANDGGVTGTAAIEDVGKVDGIHHRLHHGRHVAKRVGISHEVHEGRNVEFGRHVSVVTDVLVELGGHGAGALDHAGEHLVEEVETAELGGLEFSLVRC